MKKRLNKNIVSVATLLILAIAMPLATWACTTPVWRYALERWWPDPYRVEIEHSGELSADQQESIALLESAWEDADLPANIIVAATNVVDEGTATLTVEHPSRRRVPADNGEDPFWEAEVSMKAAQEVLYSPFRQKLATAIASGEKIVWFLLESGDAEADKTAMNKLEKTLEEQSAQYEEYRQEENQIATNQYADAYTLPKLEFMSLSLDRDDPQEQFFVESLLHAEPDLETVEEPILYAAFGKGRCLPALVGDGITEENIQWYADFMGGACSCQVKHQNPGYDLLLAINWEKALEDIEQYEDDVQPVLTGVMAAAETNTATVAADAETGPDDATSADDTAEPDARPQTESDLNLTAIIVLVLGGVLAIAVGGTLLVRKQNKG